MANSTPKIVYNMFEKAVETFETQTQLLDLVKVNQYNTTDLQRSGNVVWKKIPQNGRTVSGWDVSSSAREIIQLEYPCILGDPQNDIIDQRVDDLRDEQQWVDAAMASAGQLATDFNAALATAIKNQGSLFYRTNATSGYDVIGEANVMMDERQIKNNGRNFIFNNRDGFGVGKDLAARQNVMGLPSDVWRSGYLTEQVAGFDKVLVGSYIPALAGGADPATTVTGNQTFAPLGGTINQATGVVTNYDYRSATIPVASSASYAVGDRVTIANGGTTVKALRLSDRLSTGQAQIFTIVSKASGYLTISPRPIAADDTALSDTELMYANIDTLILNGATVNRLNTSASVTPNLFFDKEAIEVMAGDIPGQTFAQFGGGKFESKTLKNGVKLYLMYDNNIGTAVATVRLFTWYGITVRFPQACGCCEKY